MNVKGSDQLVLIYSAFGSEVALLFFAIGQLWNTSKYTPLESNKMGLETFLLEVFGVACPALLTFAATQHLAFVPLFPKEPKFNNDLYVSCIPAAVYLVFRLYFAFIMAGSTKVPASYRSYLTGFLVVMSMIAPFFHTQLQSQLWSLYEATAGPLVKVIYDASEADVLRSIEFGKKVFLLLAAWWVLFFVLELVLRVVFMAIRGVYSAIRSTFRRST